MSPEQDPKAQQKSPRENDVCLTDAELVAFAEGALREDERERLHLHVDTCEACRELLNESVKALDPSIDTLTSRTEDDFATTFRPGTLVGDRYEIRRFIARGGMGEVYEAYDRQLRERVALKAVSSAACDSQRAIRDLKAEVALARRVTHPNVCRIYDLGTHVLTSGAELYFLTMEFVEGKTLGHLLRRHGALPLDEALRLARALLQGLGAAHSAGILHRDFKSDNVILRTDATGRRTPVILDFGLARTLDERSRARTSQQAFVGTLTYMAPEQVEGHRLSKGTDLYAFGVVWFEMLTGKLPFSGSPQLSALERLTKPPAPPNQLNPAVPSEIAEIVTRCLERVPEKRFQSAEQVLDALPPDSVLSERLSTSRHIARRGSIAFIGGVALAGAIVAFIEAQPDPPARKAAVSASPQLPPAPQESPPAPPPFVKQAPESAHSTVTPVVATEPHRSPQAPRPRGLPVPPAPSLEKESRAPERGVAAQPAITASPSASSPLSGAFKFKLKKKAAPAASALTP